MNKKEIKNKHYNFSYKYVNIMYIKKNSFK